MRPQFTLWKVNLLTYAYYVMWINVYTFFVSCFVMERLYVSVVFLFWGSVAVAGGALKWMRDRLRIVKDVGESLEEAARAAPTTGDVYFVPAFNGLYAPYWRKDARG